jgi:Mrp family chromosome partitioning ATPase
MSSPVPSDTPNAPQDALDIRAYVRPIWRRKWLIVAIVVLATLATYALERSQPKEYQATTSVYFTVVDPALAVGSVTPTTPPTSQQIQDIATLFTAQSVTATVYHRLGLSLTSPNSVDIAPQIGSNAASTSFVGVRATSRSPTLAARLANTYVSVFLASRRSAQAAAAKAAASAAQTSLNTLANIPVNEAERQSLLLEISQYKTIAVDPSAGAQQINPAIPPTGPSSPKPLRDALFGGIVGLLFAIGLAFSLELLDRRLVRVAALESIYGRPVLAVLPEVPDPAPLVGGDAVVPPELLEPVRGLRVNLRLAGGDTPPQSVLIASGFPGEGKSTISRDLALVCADAGERVLLIDADLRRPTIAWLCGIEPGAGLTEVLAGTVRLAAAVVPVPRPTSASATGKGNRRSAAARGAVSGGGVDLLAHGELLENPAPLLSSSAMKGLLAAASRSYDVIILDTAPILAVADTVPLLGMVDAIVLVARLELATRDGAERVREVIGRVRNANLVGVVANGTRDAFLDERSGSYYGEYGAYGYGGASGPRDPKKTASDTA